MAWIDDDDDDDRWATASNKQNILFLDESCPLLLGTRPYPLNTYVCTRIESQPSIDIEK